MLTLWLPAKVQEATKVNELLAGNLICVDVHSLPLARQEVCGVDGASAAAVHRIKGIPAAQTCTDVCDLVKESILARATSGPRARDGAR